MSKRIERQIAEMVERIDLEHPPVTLDELNGMVEHQPHVPVPMKRSSGPAIALATAAGVLALGLVTLMIRDTAPGSTAVSEPTPSPPVRSEVSVTISSVSGHAGDDLAGVLYEGGMLTDLDRDAVGGFWWVVSSDDEATTTEMVRKPGDTGVGRFPFVSDEALTVEPGMYTLVVWVDDGLGPVSRWVPLNTDGRGLFGCQMVFEVGDDAQTDVVVAVNLQPDGWNIDCASGLTIPGTDSADPVTPSMSSSATSMQWNPILAQTKARQALPAATCPPGSNPDALGPADQQRPWGAAWSNQAAVFDEHVGRIIFIDEMGDTWTFDVCSNTWDKANPTLVPADPQSRFSVSNLCATSSCILVYDVDSDLTIAFGNDALAVYDSNSNTWTQRSKPTTYDTRWVLGAVYDPVSGLVVLLTFDTGLVAYDVETDEWTPMGEIGEGEYQAYLIGHIADTDRFGFLRPTTNSPRRTSGEFDDEGMVVDLRIGESEGLKAPGDGVFAGFGRLSYATSTQTPVVEADGNGICQLNPVTLDWTCVSLADGPDSDGAGLIGGIVGDPINDRIVLIYGYGPGFDGKTFYDVTDIWAIDFKTGQWTQLLTQTGK